MKPQVSFARLDVRFEVCRVWAVPITTHSAITSAIPLGRFWDSPASHFGWALVIAQPEFPTRQEYLFGMVLGANPITAYFALQSLVLYFWNFRHWIANMGAIPLGGTPFILQSPVLYF